MSKKKYCLYALRSDPKGIEAAQKERFNRITLRYALVYKRGPKPPDSVEIKGEDIKRLTGADEYWLLECNMKLVEEETAKNSLQMRERLNSMVDRLGVALEEEKTKLEGGGDDECEP